MTASASTISPPPTAEQYEEKEFGFWLYLMSDAAIFALLFATYTVSYTHLTLPTILLV